jgi:hypothetical protein
MSKSKVLDVLDQARSGRSTSRSQLEDWLAEDPNRSNDLKDAVVWFRDNRGPRFGWKALLDALRTIPGWEDFPVKEKAFRDYVESHHYELLESLDVK